MSDPWVDLGGGVKGKIKLFQNMVMLHIKLKGITGAATCNMVANMMLADPPPPHPNPGGQKVKIQLFQNMVILHIKLKAIMNAVFCPQPSPDPRVKKSNLTFAEHDHVAYQIKGNRECSNMVANILPAAPLSPQKVKIPLFQNMVMLHIKGIANATTR